MVSGGLRGTSHGGFGATYFAGEREEVRRYGTAAARS